MWPFCSHLFLPFLGSLSLHSSPARSALSTNLPNDGPTSNPTSPLFPLQPLPTSTTKSYSSAATVKDSTTSLLRNMSLLNGRWTSVAVMVIMSTLGAPMQSLLNSDRVKHVQSMQDGKRIWQTVLRGRRVGWSLHLLERRIP